MTTMRGEARTGPTGVVASGAVKATSFGVAAILLWAALAFFTVSAGALPPFELLSMAFAVACLGGTAVLACRGWAGLAELRQAPLPWVTAFAGLFLYHALYFFALQAAPPARASLVAYLWPLLIVLLSALLPGESLRARHLFGAALGLAGTAIVVLGRDGGSAGAPAPLVGYMAAAGCAVVWSGYSVLNRRFAAVPSGMLVGVCGAVALAGAACHAATEATVVPSPSQAVAVLLLGLGPTGLAFLAWDHATKHGNLPLLGALSYLAPLLSTLILVATGQAPGGLSLFAAGALVIAGASVAAGRPARRPSSER